MYTFILLLICFVGLSTQQAGRSIYDMPRCVLNLPGLEEMPNFNMYSGYLRGGTKPNQYFYWFNEAEQSENEQNENEKLIIWLGGEVGLSSLHALFKGNGPFTLNDETGELERNEFSWNKFAHTLYIDTPLKTGFSWNEDVDDSMVNDDIIVTNLLAALEGFFYILFPKHQRKDIYLAGESGAGLFISLLAARIMDLSDDHILKRQLKGIVLGNAYLDEKIMKESWPEFGYFNGLVDKTIDDVFHKYDCYDMDNLRASHNTEARTDCLEALHHVQENLFGRFGNRFNFGKTCYRLQQPVGVETSQGSIDNDYECVRSEALKNYLNRDDVKRAIHAKPDLTWKLIDADVYVTYNLFRGWLQSGESSLLQKDMFKVMSQLLNQTDQQILLYNGDQSVRYNYVASQQFIDQLGLKPIGDRHIFMLTDENGSEAAGGSIELYNNLQYAIIYRAGEMATTDEPQRTFHLLQNFIQ